MSLLKAAGPLVSIVLAFNLLGAQGAAAQTFLDTDKRTLPQPSAAMIEVASAVVSGRLNDKKIAMPGSHGHKLEKPVGACIVDLWDNSISVTPKRKELQRAALIHSLTSPEFSRALKEIPHQRIGLHIAFFDHIAKPAFPDNPGWILVDEETRFDVARMIKQAVIPQNGYTRTDIAIEHSLNMLQDCVADGPDKANVIDIMTDGKLNFPRCQPSPYNCIEGIPFALAARNEATRRGVTINVLAMVISSEADLPEWAQRFMVTPGADEQVGLGLRTMQDAIKPGRLFILPDAEKQSPAEWAAAFNELKTRKLIIEMGLGPDGWNRFAHAYGLPQIGIGETVIEAKIGDRSQLALAPQ